MINKIKNIFRGAHKDGNYEYKKTINKQVNLKSYANFFITLLENREKNIIQKNSFPQTSKEGEAEPLNILYEDYYKQKVNYIEYIYNK